jgi:hypothetical protein
MKNKNPYRVYSLWNKFKKVLSGMDAQDFVLLQPSTRGSGDQAYYIRGGFIYEGVKKTIRIMIMPNYIGDFGISSQYRDELTLVSRNTKVSAKEIKLEMNRLIDIWDLGKTSESLFENVISKSHLCAHVSRASDDEDRNSHIDYHLTLYKEDGREGPMVNVDVKSSLPAHISKNALLYRRDTDGVYEVDASETTIAAAPGWATAVILEILLWEQENNKAG